MTATRTDSWYMATMAVFGLVAVGCFVAVCFSAEQEIPALIKAPVSIGIVGPDRVEAGTGKLIRLEADVPDGHSVTWLPLAPLFGLQPDYHFLEQGGLVWGCAVPTAPTTVRVQLIDWDAQTWEFAEVVVGDSPGPPPPPPPPPSERLTILIIEETRDRGDVWGDIWNVLQRDQDIAKHSLAIIDDDQTGALAAYASMTAERPAIILDTDYSPTEVLYVGPCPDSVEKIKALVKCYGASGTPGTGSPGLDTPPSAELESETTRPSEVEAAAPIPQRISKTEQPRYVWITLGGKRYGRDNETGQLFPVDESRLTFCVGDRCFKVPPK